MATAEGDDAEASEARAALARATTQLEQLQVAALVSARTTPMAPSCTLPWVRVATMPRTGLACCCGCIHAGAQRTSRVDASAGASRNDAKTVGAGAGARAAGDGAHTPTVAGGRLVVPCAYAFGWLRREEGAQACAALTFRRRVEAPHLVRSRAGGTASTRRDWERQ